MEFRVEQEAFSGPLGLLLELIDSQKLSISKVSLAEVTESYLRRMESEKIPVHELADFLLIASRLIYLKSRELMPFLQTKEDDAGVDALEEQLRLYKEFVEAAKLLEVRFGGNVMHPRPFVKIAQKEVRFSPPKSLTADFLAEVYQGILKRLEPFFALQETSMERVKSVEERIEELHSALTARSSMSFGEVVRTARSKMEVVVSFLALLELLRRQMVTVKQAKAFEEIELERM